MTHPLRDDNVIILKGAKSFNPQELIDTVEKLGFEPYLTTRFELVEDEIKKLLIEKGVSYVWQLARFREELLPPSDITPKSALMTILSKMLNKLAPVQDFIIIDPYLFSANDSNYIDDLVMLLEPIVKQVHSIGFVTNSKDDNQATYSILFERLNKINKNCAIIHDISKNYHDRFWIADGQRGLFVGTSLNGLGKRYTLADYIKDSDVKEIIQSLKDNSLLVEIIK